MIPDSPSPTALRHCLALMGTALLPAFFPASASAQDPLYLKQSPGITVPDYQMPDYGLGPGAIDQLIPYPQVNKGDRTPFDIWRYGGKVGGSFGNPYLPVPWEQWVKNMTEQKPQLMADVRA